MATKKKMLQAAAGNATGGAGLDITEVFSTYLYTGNSASQPINNGVDLNGEGGMVWLKARTAAYNNIIVDSERGSSNGTAYNPLFTNLTNAENTAAGYGVTSFDSNGFTLGPSGQQAISNQGGASYGDIDYASWTFRKAPKFFDVVTYTGDGTTDGSKKVLHNLGSAPGCIIVKRTDSTGEWNVYHRGITSSPETRALYLNQTSSYGTGGAWGSTLPTDTEFTVGSSATVNISNATYVAYLFAHNDGDGEFGPSGDADIIKCGSYAGNATSVDLGFEPQFIIVKRTDSAENWMMFDSMRGWNADGNSLGWLMPNKSSKEGTLTIGNFRLTSTGFEMSSGYSPLNNGSSSSNYIYMAIRRGPLAQPESGTEVFAIDTKTTPEPAYNSGFVVDMAIQRNISVATSNATTSRLLQKKRLLTDSTNAEENSTTFMFDYNTGWSSDAGFNDTNNYSWMWKRAPGFFDVVAYTGNSTSGRTVSHNLGVAPEMMWIKRRDITASWCVYHSAIGATGSLDLDNTGASNAPNAGARFDDTEPTSSVFTVGNFSETNNNNNTYIAYLFATLPGVSKVGSYTGNGTSQTIDCGFTSGARFVLIKATNVTGNWIVYDTERGIIVGNDPALALNTTDAELTGYDLIDPQSSGFTVVNDNSSPAAYETNANNVEYIFYAIA